MSALHGFQGEEVPNFTSFSDTVNHIRDEYDSQKGQKAFTPSATENAPTSPSPTAAYQLHQQQHKQQHQQHQQQHKLKKVVRKKRLPRPDFSFSGIGSTLDSAIGTAIGSVGKLFGGAPRSTAGNNNLQFEKFQVPFVPSATLQPDGGGDQQKREIASSHAPEKDDLPSGAEIPAIPAIPQIPAIPAIPPITPPNQQSIKSNEHKAAFFHSPEEHETPEKTAPTAHRATPPAPSAAPPQRLQGGAYPPYRSRTPAFVRDAVAQYFHTLINHSLWLMWDRL